MEKKSIFSNKYVNYSLILIAGFFLGWLIFHPSHSHIPESETTQVNPQETIWTCSMHPQFRLPQPGKCPICGMDLIPLEQGGAYSEDPDAIRLTAEAVQLANVQTIVVSRQIPLKEVRLYGKVETDERLIQNQVAHIPGRIENLFVSFIGEPVSPGQKLGQIYSPDLITAQQELLIAARSKGSQPEIYEAAREKLRQWKLTDAQISDIESSGDVKTLIDILANTSGVVMTRKVSRGDYVTPGTVLFEISDLSKVWVMFEAYESDLPYVKNGEKISFALQALPGETFSGNITFIDPVLDPLTRIARVRVETANSSGKLKPGMFATGRITSVPQGYGENIVIPKSAVLWTGKRSIVYVKQAGASGYVFKMREIELGPALGESYVVQSGLNEGEEIVYRGTFSVDAAAQLEGKPSMMNPPGGVMSSSAGMEMHGLVKSNEDRNMGGKGRVTQPGDSPVNQPGPSTLKIASFGVSGLCEMCKERIETAAKSITGVSSATWDMNTKILDVRFDPSLTALETIQKAIAGAGHDNGKYKAPDEVYNKLPECCLYRK